MHTVLSQAHPKHEGEGGQIEREREKRGGGRKDEKEEGKNGWMSVSVPDEGWRRRSRVLSEQDVVFPHGEVEVKNKGERSG